MYDAYVGERNNRPLLSFRVPTLACNNGVAISSSGNNPVM